MYNLINIVWKLYLSFPISQLSPAFVICQIDLFTSHFILHFHDGPKSRWKEHIGVATPIHSRRFLVFFHPLGQSFDLFFIECKCKHNHLSKLAPGMGIEPTYPLINSQAHAPCSGFPEYSLQLSPRLKEWPKHISRGLKWIEWVFHDPSNPHRQ